MYNVSIDIKNCVRRQELSGTGACYLGAVALVGVVGERYKNFGLCNTSSRIRRANGS